MTISLARFALRNCYAWQQTVFTFLLALAVGLITLGQARAMKIQEVVSPGGIKAWLVEEHAVPLVAIQFAFKGGAAQDNAGKEGTAYFLSGMLDEGAGDLTSLQYQERIEQLAVRITYDANRDTFTGSFQSLTKNRTESLELLKLALTKPRFDKDAIERIRGQDPHQSEIRRQGPRQTCVSRLVQIGLWRSSLRRSGQG